MISIGDTVEKYSGRTFKGGYKRCIVKTIVDSPYTQGASAAELDNGTFVEIQNLRRVYVEITSSASCSTGDTNSAASSNQ